MTSKNPTTRTKNPQKVAAGKAIAAKTEQARKAQKRGLAKACVIIASHQLKEPEKESSPAIVRADTNTVVSSDRDTRKFLTTTQWFNVISIVVSMVGMYYDREQIKKPSTKRPPKTPPPLLANAAPPAVPRQRRGICKMDYKKSQMNFSVFDIYDNNAGEFNVRKVFFDAFAAVGAVVVLNAFHETMFHPHISWGANMWRICNCYECSSFTNLCDYCAEDVGDEVWSKMKKKKPK